jgi:hypothetical protein
MWLDLRFALAANPKVDRVPLDCCLDGEVKSNNCLALEMSTPAKESCQPLPIFRYELAADFPHFHRS